MFPLTSLDTYGTVGPRTVVPRPPALPRAAAVDRPGSARHTTYPAKRLLDVACAAVGLTVLAPLLALVALIVRLESHGPVFFRQQRRGLGGRTFWMWKFRTMHTDAEARLAELERFNESPEGVLFKVRNDPRVTRFGRLLRKSSLDELPQLFNVLKGEMSLVGPRPLPLRDCARLEELDPVGFARRHQVTPGLTCLWQVSGRSLLGGGRMLALDCEYIRDQSLWLDLRILARTALVLLTDRGGSY